MTAKKHTRKKAQAVQTETAIRYAAIAVIVIVIALLAWRVIESRTALSADELQIVPKDFVFIFWRNL